MMPPPEEARCETVQTSTTRKRLEGIRQSNEEDYAESAKGNDERCRWVPNVSLCQWISHMAMMLLPTLLPNVRYPRIPS